MKSFRAFELLKESLSIISNEYFDCKLTKKFAESSFFLLIRLLDELYSAVFVADCLN